MRFESGILSLETILSPRCHRGAGTRNTERLHSAEPWPLTTWAAFSGWSMLEAVHPL